MLDAAYIKEAEQRARRFQGAWTGTSGTLAADVIHLLNERKETMATMAELEQANQSIRDAVTARLDASDDQADEPTAIADAGADTIPVDWILRGERELKAEDNAPRMRGDGILAADQNDQPHSRRLLLDAADAVNDRRTKYGPPSRHFAITVALINAAFGTNFVPEDWATIMMLDKIARSRGPGDHPDNDIDVAGYAACRSECRQA